MNTESGTDLSGDILIESSIDAMIAIGPDETVMAWNGAATQLFAVEREKVIGQPLMEVLAFLKNDDEFTEALEWSKKGKKSFLPASMNQRYRKQVEIHVIPLERKKMPKGVMLLIHDVSHRIAKEQQLQQLNLELRNRLRQLHLLSSELSQLTQLASHSIRGPIREIYTAVEGLLHSEAKAMSNSGRAAFRRIQTSLNRMNLLLDDVATLTQINLTHGDPSPVDVEELVAVVKEHFAKRLEDANATLSHGPVCTVLAHREQLILLLQQLISNIIRFPGTENPRITITCEKVWYNDASDLQNRSGQYFHLALIHNSPVFDTVSSRVSLSDPISSETRNYTGPAIAMIIAGKIMDVHWGFLQREKLPDGGNLVSFYFPLGDSD